MSNNKSKSPYQRYNKAPWRYSDLYDGWKAAKLAGRDREADGYARKHHDRFVRFGDELFGPVLGPVERRPA